MSKLRIFISSPGDVFEERAIAERVIQRLQSEYVGRVMLEPVLWEHEPLVATANFQEQIIRPSDTDVVVSILWSRLGTRLPRGFTRKDGSRYDSGTEYEFEDALQGYREHGKPDLLVYRKTAPPSVRLDDENALLERLQQKKKLDDFVSRWFHDAAEGTLIAAFHAFDSPSDFENLLEAHLHKLIERKLPDALASASQAPAVWKKGSPFRGLHAFEFEHAPVFFGRTKAVSDILQALRDQAVEGRSFVLVLGMSGGGKSSVIRAGVLPMLTQPGVIEGVAFWRRAIFRPGDTPGDLFTGLASAMLRDHGLPSLDAESEGPAQFAQVLRDSPQSAVMLIKSALDQTASKQAKAAPLDGKKVDCRLALVIDQMEEMFTQDGITAKDRKAFANTLDVLARCGRVWIIGTLRSDFYPRLVDLPVIGELKEGNGQYDLMPPVSSEIGQMIRLPTRAAGLRFEEDPASSERLDDMLRDAAAEHPEILPLLQFTLEELYQRRTANGTLTLSAYRELGGVEGSLAQRAETVFQELPPEVQAALPKVLNALVSIEQDGHETIGRKRAPWRDATDPAVRTLLETFVAARLFVTELADDGPVVTVSHEALLWHWPRVSDWVDQNRENLRIRGRIAIAAERWEQENKPVDLLLPRGKPLGEAETLLEQDIDLSTTEAAFIGASIARAKRAQKLRGTVVAMLAILAILAGSAAFLASQQRNRAIEAQTRAEVEAETARRTTEFMVGLFEVSDPSEALGNTITAREIMDRGADRIEAELVDQPQIQATLMETMGTVYTSLALYPQAESLLRRALELRSALYGEQHLEVARTYDRLGQVLTRKADYSEAGDALTTALSIRQDLLGAEHLDIAESLSSLAELHAREGGFELAEPLLRQALDMRTSILGTEHMGVAQSMERLGLNMFDRGDYAAAEAMLSTSIGMRRKLLKDNPHPQLAEGLNNLGLVLMEMGNIRAAQEMYQEALEMNQRMLDEAHPAIAVNMNNLALLYHDSGNFDAAEEMYRDVIDVRERSLGAEHPEVALALSNLAYLLYDKGDSDAAMSLQEQAIEKYRLVFPLGHPDLASSLGALGSWLTNVGRYTEAEPLLLESMQMRISIFGEDHIQVAVGQTALGQLYLATGRIEQAEQTARAAHAVLMAQLPEDHWRTAWAASIHGSALAHMQQFDAAESMLLDSLGILRQGPGSGSRTVYIDKTVSFLADLYRGWGKADKAAAFLAMLDGDSRR